MTCFVPTRRNAQFVSPVNDLIRHFFDEVNEATDSRLAPVEVHDEEKNVLVLVEVAGVNREDISIQYQDRILTVSGEKKSVSTDESKGVYAREINYGKFSRRICVGDVNFDAAQAKIENGQLRIMIPKADAAQAQKLIIQ